MAATPTPTPTPAPPPKRVYYGAVSMRRGNDFFCHPFLLACGSREEAVGAAVAAATREHALSDKWLVCGVLCADADPDVWTAAKG